MPSTLVSPEEFLARLTSTFSDPSSSGSIWLTHKRYTYEVADADGDATMNDDETEYDVLIRCTSAKGDTFSSRVPASSVHSFHATYGTLLKASMAGHMRKRDKKREKARAEAEVKRVREVYVDVVVGNEGKRGKGRRQRMRKLNAQRKKEAERERLELRDAAKVDKSD